MKLLLRKTTKNQTLRIDELQTLFLEAAAVMNSRPLIPIETHSSDGDEPLPLYTSLLEVPSDSCQQMYHHHLYTHTARSAAISSVSLQTSGDVGNKSTSYKRSRWRNEINNLAEGDVVLLKD